VLAEGFDCGLHRIERLMHAQALRARPRRRNLPRDEGQRSAIAPSTLGLEFLAERPNQRWIADFTYIWTAEGWLYVAAVIDLFSRRVVGWSMKADMTVGLVADALMMAIWRREALRPCCTIRTRAVSMAASSSEARDRQRRHLLDVPLWQCLGQRPDGELLLDAEDRADQRQGVPDT
jgi:transposase InsO family protein